MDVPDLSKAAGDRFSVVSAFPAVMVVLTVYALIKTGAFSGAPDVHKLIPADEKLGAGVVLLLALLVFVLALLLQPFQLALVRMLEGYWGNSAPARGLTWMFVAPRRRRLRAYIEAGTTDVDAIATESPRADEQLRVALERKKLLRRQAKANRIRMRYPRRMGRVMPTSLGNALRSFEDTAGQRYGLETVPVFRRLHPLLPPGVLKSYTSHRLQLDAAAGMCVAFLVMTFVLALALVGDGWWVLCPVATAGLAWLTYRGAITSALLMGRTVTTAFDLHRHDLVAALHFPAPPDAALEYAFNLRLSDWLRDDDPDQVPAPQIWFSDYAHIDPSASSSAQGDAGCERAK